MSTTEFAVLFWLIVYALILAVTAWRNEPRSFAYDMGFVFAAALWPLLMMFDILKKCAERERRR